MSKKPVILAQCDQCVEHRPETSCWPPEQIAWDGKEWLCDECWSEEREPETSWKDAPKARYYVNV